jgi:KUP system potassium uptake protein
MKTLKNHGEIPISAAAALVAIGVVYGDIGTSPMYVMKSIMAGNGGLSSMGVELVLGSLSLVIWTVILLTTVKYVMVAMQAICNGGNASR